MPGGRSRTFAVPEVVAQPDPTAAGLPPAGRCDGIAGDAETTTGPRRGAEDIARAFHETYERLAPEHGYETRKASAVPWDRVPEQNRGLMVAVVADLLERGIIALESEVVALTDALGDPALTHEYDPAPWSGRICGFVYDDDGADCCMNADHPVHRTPARVRAELEGP